MHTGTEDNTGSAVVDSLVLSQEDQLQFCLGY